MVTPYLARLAARDTGRAPVRPRTRARFEPLPDDRGAGGIAGDASTTGDGLDELLVEHDAPLRTGRPRPEPTERQGPPDPVSNTSRSADDVTGWSATTPPRPTTPRADPATGTPDPNLSRPRAVPANTHQPGGSGAPAEAPTRPTGRNPERRTAEPRALTASPHDTPDRARLNEPRPHPPDRDPASGSAPARSLADRPPERSVPEPTRPDPVTSPTTARASQPDVPASTTPVVAGPEPRPAPFPRASPPTHPPRPVRADQPARPPTARPEPVIHVSIGRIHVRVNQPPAPEAAPPRRTPERPRPSSLDEYLETRSTRRRR
jgi:hypothetical protein